MKISAYTKIHDGNKHKYPWKESILSMSTFADEVVVVDSGSTDGTWEELVKMSHEEHKIIPYQKVVDLGCDDFAHKSDGLQKAFARSLCFHDVLFQFDCDELIGKNDGPNIRGLCEALYEDFKDSETEVFLFPMLEFWGKDKFRIDIPFYKPRISFNSKKVTHDIPIHLRAETDSGRIYSKGSDGCDYVLSNNSEIIKPFSPIPLDQLNFLENARVYDKELYENGLLKLAFTYGCIYHYSWFDIPRKIRTYRDYWSKHWNSLFNGSLEDTAENNMFFNKPWSEVSEEEIDLLGKRLEAETGGHIFHSRVDFDKLTGWISTDKFKDVGFLP